MSKWEDDLKLVKEAYPDLGEEFGSTIDGMILGSASVGMDLYDKMTLPETFGSTSPADLYKGTGHIRTYPERFGEGLMERDTSGVYVIPSPGEEAIRDFYMSDDEGMAGPAIPPGGYPHYSTEPSGEATMYDEDEWRRMIRESGRRPAPVAAAEVSPYTKTGAAGDAWEKYIRPGMKWLGDTIPFIGRSDTSSTETVDEGTKLLRDMMDADEESRKDMDRLLRETEEYDKTFKKISGEYDEYDKTERPGDITKFVKDAISEAEVRAAWEDWADYGSPTDGSSDVIVTDPDTGVDILYDGATPILDMIGPGTSGTFGSKMSADTSVEPDWDAYAKGMEARYLSGELGVEPLGRGSDGYVWDGMPGTSTYTGSIPTLDERLDVPDVRTYTPAAGEGVDSSLLDYILPTASAGGTPITESPPISMADRLKSIEDGTAFEGMKEGGWGADGLAALGAIPGGAILGGTLGAVGGMLSRGTGIHKALTGSRIPGTAGTVDEYARAKAVTAAGDDARLAAGEFAFPVGERGPISWLADVPILGPLSKKFKEVLTRDVDVLSSTGMLTDAGKISSTAERELVSKVARDVYGESTLATRAAVKKRLADELPDHDLGGWLPKVAGTVASKATDYLSAMTKTAIVGKAPTEYARTVPKSTLDDFVGPGKLKAGEEMVGSGVDAAFRRGMADVAEDMYGKMSTSALKGGGIGTIGGIGVGAALDAKAAGIPYTDPYPGMVDPTFEPTATTHYDDVLKHFETETVPGHLPMDITDTPPYAEIMGESYKYDPVMPTPSAYSRPDMEPSAPVDDFSSMYIPSPTTDWSTKLFEGTAPEDYYRLSKDVLESAWRGSLGEKRGGWHPYPEDHRALAFAVGKRPDLYGKSMTTDPYGRDYVDGPRSFVTEIYAPGDDIFKASPYFGGTALPPEIAAEILGAVDGTIST